nr:hypothetical protein [uncultured Blautia sp.]
MKNIKLTGLLTRKKAVRYLIYFLLVCVFAVFVIRLNQVEKTELVVRTGQTFEKAKVVKILQDNLEENGTRVGEQKVRVHMLTGVRKGDDDDKIRLNQRKPSKYKGLSRFGPEKNLQRINKFMKERPTFYKKLIQMKENFRFYLRCFYCITKVVILQFNSEKQDRISS